MMVSGILAGLLFNRIGPKRLCIGAGLILTAGYFLMTRLHADTHAGFVILALGLIGSGLGLMIAPASNMIMNSVAKKKQGMVSSVTTLSRFVPLTPGIAAFNRVFTQGIIALAKSHEITKLSPVAIQKDLLAAGFDLAFLISLVLGIVIIVLSLLAKVEIHPDYLHTSGDDEPVTVIL